MDTSRFDRALRDPGLLPGEVSAARERDARLHLVLAGGGPEEEPLRERLCDNATFLGWLEGDALARAYASADLFLFASCTDTFGQVLLEAQASGLPVVAVAQGGPLSLIDDGRTGLLRPAEPGALADVSERTWEGALERLAEGYRLALGQRAGLSAAAGRRTAA